MSRSHRGDKVVGCGVFSSRHQRSGKYTRKRFPCIALGIRCNVIAGVSDMFHARTPSIPSAVQQ
jgi:hypothetical protein